MLISQAKETPRLKVIRLNSERGIQKDSEAPGLTVSSAVTEECAEVGEPYMAPIVNPRGTPWIMYSTTSRSIFQNSVLKTLLEGLSC